MQPYPKTLTSAGLAGLLALAASAAFADPVRVHLDEETTVGGIPVACTGIGQTKNDPKWLGYPVRVEFADAAHDYLAGEVLTLSDARGHELLQVSCEGPWVLLKLPPRLSYRIEARATEHDVGPQTARVKAPSHGQARFVLTFPNAR
jgi:hypothetical protein